MKKMYIMYIWIIIALLYVPVCFMGCGLFKKTTKHTLTNNRSSLQQMQSDLLVLKRANKETQVFTYWNDSSFYQYQTIREQADEAKSDQLKAQQQETNSYRETVRKSNPAYSWVYAGIGLALIVGGILIYKRIKTAVYG